MLMRDRPLAPGYASLLHLDCLGVIDELLRQQLALRLRKWLSDSCSHGFVVQVREFSVRQTVEVVFQVI